MAHDLVQKWPSMWLVCSSSRSCHLENFLWWASLLATGFDAALNGCFSMALSNVCKLIVIARSGVCCCCRLPFSCPGFVLKRLFWWNCSDLAWSLYNLWAHSVSRCFTSSMADFKCHSFSDQWFSLIACCCSGLRLMSFPVAVDSILYAFLPRWYWSFSLQSFLVWTCS